jgi:hypothetical protein
MIVNAIGNNNYDGTVDGWEYDWSFQNTLLFTITIMSTVGYGHISPSTFEGRMFTLPYAWFGIFLFIVSTARFGNFLAEGIKRVYR